MPSPEHVKPLGSRGASGFSRKFCRLARHFICERGSRAQPPTTFRRNESSDSRVLNVDGTTSNSASNSMVSRTFRKQSPRVNGKTNRFARSPVKRNCSRNLGRGRIGGVAGMKSRRAFKEKKGGRIDFQDWCDDICLVYGRTYARVRTSEVRRSINRPLLKSHINALTRTPTHSQPLSLPLYPSSLSHSLFLSLRLFPSV